MRSRPTIAEEVCAFVSALTLCGCSSSEAMPPLLGNCTPQGDASCTVSQVVGSTSSGDSGHMNMDASDAQSSLDSPGSADVSDANTCGPAAQDISGNAQCQPCVTSRCCVAVGACDDQCVQLILNCAPPNPSQAFDTCAGKYSPLTFSAFSDLAQCVNTSCTPECGSLPLSGD